MTTRMSETEVAWRKSSYSANGNCVEMAWQKSSHSASGECVEVAVPGEVHVRDTKDRDGGELKFGRQEWLAFLEILKA